MADGTLVTHSIAQDNAKVNAAAPTSIDTNPYTHTPQENEQIQEYVNSVDEGMRRFVKDVMEGNNPKPYALKGISDRAARDIFEITGIDVSGFQTKIEPRMIEHINARHGAHGSADSSMENVDDIARMQYVLDHYDDIQDGGRVSSYKEPNPKNPSRSRPAQSVVYTKKVNGSYYIVQAVPDTKTKTSYIVSAYMQKNREPKIPIMPQGTSGSVNAVSKVPIDFSIAQENAEGNQTGDVLRRMTVGLQYILDS